MVGYWLLVDVGLRNMDWVVQLIEYWVDLVVVGFEIFDWFELIVEFVEVVGNR